MFHSFFFLLMVFRGRWFLNFMDRSYCVILLFSLPRVRDAPGGDTPSTEETGSGKNGGGTGTTVANVGRNGESRIEGHYTRMGSKAGAHATGQLG